MNKNKIARILSLATVAMVVQLLPFSIWAGPATPGLGGIIGGGFPGVGPGGFTGGGVVVIESFCPGGIGGTWGVTNSFACNGQSVPEPGPIGLMILGAVALVVADRIRRNK